jgi:hypothetical protein
MNALVCDFDDWIGIYGFNELRITSGIPKIQLEYQLPEKSLFEISADLNLTFEFECTLPMRRDTAHAVIKQLTFIGLNSTRELSFMQLLNCFFRLYKFLSIAYYDSPNIETLFFRNNKTQKDNGHQNTVEVLYSDNFFNRSYKKGPRLNKYLFKYEDVKEQFPTIIKTWFEIYDKIGPAVNLLVELLLKREYALELKFLSAVQAVESFHRNIFGGEDLQKAEHKIRIRNIVENVPEQYKAWLKEKLAFSNELSLKNRLIDLYSKIPDEITKALINDPTNFFNGVVKTRNHYTHYGSGDKKTIMSSQDIFKAVEKLKVLLICSILNELHFSKDQIIGFVKVEKVYRYED